LIRVFYWQIDKIEVSVGFSKSVILNLRFLKNWNSLIVHKLIVIAWRGRNCK